VTAIVLHRTEQPEIGSTLNSFIDGKENAHYLVDVDGHTVKMVFEADEAEHAGPSQWQGVKHVNRFSIGIEIVNQKGSFPAAQMNAVMDLVQRLMKEFNIPRHRILGHCEVRELKDSTNLTNEKAECPGPEFEWLELERRGLAATPVAIGDRRSYEVFFDQFPGELLLKGNSDSGSKYGEGNKTRDGHTGLIAELRRDLKHIGYERNKDPAGEYGMHTVRIVERFQVRYLTGSRKHLRPKELGQLNAATARAIRGVLLGRGRP
jgi:N-acetyl-anhydromuramyl-L-alanine amidase AmpD